MVTYFIYVTAFIIGLLTVLYLRIKRRYTYWEKRGIEYPKPTFLAGNAYEIAMKTLSFGEKITSIYNEMKAKKLKHVGMFFTIMPVYIPIDPEIIKNIIQRDFQHFVDRGVYSNEKHDPISAHLFSLQGQKWKTLRAKLTPTFTTGKIKMMFPTIVKIANQVPSILDGNMCKEPVEIKDILARLTTDIIGSCAFGIDCNSLRDPDTKFRKYGKMAFEDTTLRQLLSLVSFMYPNFMRFMGYNLVDKNVSEFFMGVVRDTINYREENNISRKDFINLLMQLKNKGKLDDDDEETSDEDKNIVRLTFNEIAAQVFVFFLGGFETSSSAMAFCLYELAQSQEAQQKLREEINTVLEKYDGTISYEAIGEMRYMNMVIEETMRKYPSFPVLTRICTKDYNVPDTNFHLEEGTRVFIPVGGLHYDEEYYPNPNVFDPERFNEENKAKRPAFTYLPFGEGPRICIGLRFGQLQTKVGLTVLLRNYIFALHSKTPVPLIMDPKNFLNSPLGGIWMNIEKINLQN